MLYRSAGSLTIDQATLTLIAHANPGRLPTFRAAAQKSVRHLCRLDQTGTVSKSDGSVGYKGLKLTTTTSASFGSVLAI